MVRILSSWYRTWKLWCAVYMMGWISTMLFSPRYTNTHSLTAGNGRQVPSSYFSVLNNFKHRARNYLEWILKQKHLETKHLTNVCIRWCSRKILKQFLPSRSLLLFSEWPPRVVLRTFPPEICGWCVSEWVEPHETERTCAMEDDAFTVIVKHSIQNFQHGRLWTAVWGFSPRLISGVVSWLHHFLETWRQSRQLPR